MKKFIKALVGIVLTFSICNNESSTSNQINEISIKEQEIIQYKKIVYYDIPLDKQYQDYIRNQCENANINIELVYAIMKVESEFDSSIISETNDYGIMQINTCNHSILKKELGISDFLDPYDNALAGIYMLSNLTWCDNENQMLMCYNMGTYGAKRAWEKGIYETSYSKKVLKAKEEIGGLKYEIEILCN